MLARPSFPFTPLTACVCASTCAGEEPHSGIVASVTGTVVTCVEDERLEFQASAAVWRCSWLGSLMPWVCARSPASSSHGRPAHRAGAAMSTHAASCSRPGGGGSSKSSHSQTAGACTAPGAALAVHTHTHREHGGCYATCWKSGGAQQQLSLHACSAHPPSVLHPWHAH